MPSRRDFLSAALAAQLPARKAADPVIQIKGDKFHFNDLPTYAGCKWKGHSIEGLLLNSRMVQGIFDDENPATVARWVYPDTGKWDPGRNTREFIENMSAWRKHGLRGFTINLQGGSPQGYSKEQPWRNSAIAPDGSLKPAYMQRLQLILEKAKLWHMGVILGIFYFGQDEYLENDDAVRKAVRETLLFLQRGNHWHVMVEIANECDGKGYQQPLIQAPRIHELIALAKSINTGGQRNYVSASFNGGTIPHANVVRESDFLLLHGNGVSDPKRWRVLREAGLRRDDYLARCGEAPVAFTWAPWPFLLVARHAVEAVGLPRPDFGFGGDDLEWTVGGTTTKSKVKVTATELELTSDGKTITYKKV